MPGRERNDVCVQAWLDPEASEEGWKFTTRVEVASRRSEPLFNQVHQPLHRQRVGVHAPRRHIGLLQDDPATGFHQPPVDVDLLRGPSQGAIWNREWT